jgi:dynein heavy chain
MTVLLLVLQVLSEVFLPLLSHQVAAVDAAGAGMLPAAAASHAGGGPGATTSSSSGAGGSSSGRPRELLGNMHKYLSHVKQALQQLTGDVVMHMPAVAIESVAAAAKDPDTISALQEAIVGWSQTLAEVMQREGERQPEGRGPLAEIDFWRARSAVLCGLWEQLNTHTAGNVIAVMEAGSDDFNLMSAFKSQLAELGKLAHEVRVCVRLGGGPS